MAFHDPGAIRAMVKEGPSKASAMQGPYPRDQLSGLINFVHQSTEKEKVPFSAIMACNS